MENCKKIPLLNPNYTIQLLK